MVCRCSCLSLHQVISGSARLQFEVEVISEIGRCSDAWLVTCMLSVLHGTLFETTVEFLVFKICAVCGRCLVFARRLTPSHTKYRCNLYSNNTRYSFKLSICVSLRHR